MRNSHPDVRPRRPRRLALLATLLAGVLPLALGACSSIEGRYFGAEIRAFDTPEGIQDAWIPVGRPLPATNPHSTGSRGTLHAWVYPAPDSARDTDGRAPAIIFYHGASTQIDSVGPALAPLVEKAGATLVLVSNRGFGRSTDITHVTRDSFVEDGLVAADFVRAMPGVDPARVACFGYSFGGMTSLAVARARPWINPVISGAAYSSSGMALRDRGVQYLTLLSGPAHEPIASIRHLNGRRVLLFHPTNDRMVPIEHGNRLLKEGQKHGARVSLYAIPDATHFNVLQRDPNLLDRIAEVCKEEWTAAK